MSGLLKNIQIGGIIAKLKTIAYSSIGLNIKKVLSLRCPLIHYNHQDEGF